MNKSLSRDISVLTKMLSNVTDVRTVIKDGNFTFGSDRRALYNNKFAFDLCSFYMAQFGEKVKLLTDSSRDDLCKVADLSTIKYFRNLIDHDYESANKQVLQAYIQVLSSDKILRAITNRIMYCRSARRK